MNKISFIAAFGDEGKVVSLTSHFGSGRGYFIMIDNYYNGSINMTSEGYKVYFNSDDYTQTDADILIDKLLESF